MLHIELDIDDIDYEALARVLIPLARESKTVANSPLGSFLGSNASAGLIMSVLRSSPKEKKEGMAADLISKNGATIKESIEKYAKEQGVALKIRSVRAKA